MTGGGGDPPSNSYSVLTGALTPRHFDRPRQLTPLTPRQFDKQDRGRYHGYEECLIHAPAEATRPWELKEALFLEPKSIVVG